VHLLQGQVAADYAGIELGIAEKPASRKTETRFEEGCFREWAAGSRLTRKYNATVVCAWALGRTVGCRVVAKVLNGLRQTKRIRGRIHQTARQQ
jgi:hypothetical protein